MAARIVFFLQNAHYEPSFQVASMAITAAAMGEDVYVVFAFDALRALVSQGFGQPRGDVESAESARAVELGAPTPFQMLAEARGLGVKTVACDTTVKICGIGPQELQGKLDEVMGLASIWRLTQGARVLSF